jgi:chromosome segregation ATPase
MAAHVDGPCSMKPVDCPFAMIGCRVACTQGDLEEHLESHVAHHLSLTMRVLTAQQRSLNDLQATTQKQAAVQAAAATQVAELADVRSRVGVLESRLEEQQRQATEAERELRAALQQNSKEQKSGLKGAHAEHERLASAHENLRATVDAVVAQMAQGAHGGSPQALR